MLGLLYGIVVIIVSFLAANGGFSWDSLIMLGTALLTGSLGGMVGVNMRR
jgi:putative membrane protein (TIGR04086 family)